MAAYGLVLDPWQEDVLRAGLGERSNGMWAVRQVGVCAPRQQGKTMLIVARVLAGLLLFDEQTIIVSAHRQDTAREVFFRLVQIIEDNPSLEERVDFIARSEMREFIRLKSGQEVRFKARSSGSGRGFSCDCLMLDEAQILGAAAWSAILPTMSARPNPQVWLLGTPPTPLDDGEVFTRIREAGLQGRESRLSYLEWSAEPGDDFDDPQTWAKANPAYGSRISHEAIASERATMSDEQFAMERLGIWASITSRQGVIPADAWADRLDADSIATGSYALGIEVAPDMASASVVMAGQRDDGAWHVEVARSSAGASWVQAYVQRIVEQNDQLGSVVVDVAGPVAAILDKRGDTWRLGDVRVTPIKVAELGVACMTLRDGVVSGWLRHMGDPFLNIAVQSAGKRDLGDTGRWVFSRKSTTSDITPIQSAALALWGAQNSSSQVKRPLSRQGKGRKVVSW